MYCEYCGAELEDGATECPACGKAQTQKPAEETAVEAEPAEQAGTDPAADETAEQSVQTEQPEAAEEAAQTEQAEAAQTEPTEQAAEAEAPEEQKKTGRKNGGGLAAIIAAAAVVVAIVVIVAVALFGGKKNGGETEAPADEPQQSVSEAQNGGDDAQTADDGAEVEAPATGEDGAIMHTNDAGYTSYTATAEQLTDEVLDSVVATCGDRTLTNRTLGLYYWQQYYAFASAYGGYLSYFMDTSLGLDEQLYGENVTWQQQFIDRAILMFQHVSALAQEAEAAGFTLSADDQAYLDSLIDNLSEAAVGYGYESADAFLQLQFGPGVTTQEYAAYAADSTLALAYLQSLVEQRSYTSDDVSDYYDAHADAYAQNRVEKLDMPNIDIRHILIVPAEQDESGAYTEEAWQAAQQQAEELLQQWQSGEASEESFAELAISNSADGSAANGGLITDVYPGQMVDEFNDWCFDEARKVGDFGIVKSQFGYHIMYLSAIGDEIHWYTVAENDYLSELSATIEDGIAEKYELQTDLDKAAVYDVLSASAQENQ